jgi:hypothetical protein
MAFTVQEFDDLIKILEAQPEWRVRLRRALFPEIDVPKALQELAEAQKRTEAALQQLEATVRELVIGQDELRSDVGVLKQDVGVLKQDVGVLKQDVKELQRDVGILKGSDQERRYRDRADAIFGRFLRNGRNATNRVADQLYEALQAGSLSDKEVNDVLDADLIWQGQERSTDIPLVLLMEASWLAEVGDVARASTRAAILRRIGLQTLAVVGGKNWTDAAAEQARTAKVVIVSDGQIDIDSWQQARAQLA